MKSTHPDARWVLIAVAASLVACSGSTTADPVGDVGNSEDTGGAQFWPGDVVLSNDVTAVDDASSAGDATEIASEADIDTPADGAASPDSGVDDTSEFEDVDMADALSLDTLPPPEDVAAPIDVAPVCDPADPPLCDGLKRMKCSGDGTGYIQLPCAPGTGCQAGACVHPSPNVVVLVDSSDSMNIVDSLGKDAGLCFSAACPPWDFPNCDVPTAPTTRMGKVKGLLTALAAVPEAAATNLALARFPQVPGDWGDCNHGFWDYKSEITGDDDSHVTVDGGWLDTHLSEVVVAPLAVGAAAIAPWVDFIETAQATGQACVNSWDCPTNNCVNSKCQAAKNPELRALGSTPLGKSLFYVGEYLRRHVLVEGKPCSVDADCGTPTHVCSAGACHDPFAGCRATAIVVLSDGSETEHLKPTDFFHPRVQAKRFRYGLGCATTADCGPDAACDTGECRPTSADLPWDGQACEVSDLACTADSDCAAFLCGKVDPCPGICGSAAVTGVDSGGADRLLDWSGKPAVVTVHIVSASPTAGANALTAAYGGGQYLTPDLADPAALLGGIVPLLDFKAPNPCDGP